MTITNADFIVECWLLWKWICTNHIVLLYVATYGTYGGENEGLGWSHCIFVIKVNVGMLLVLPG